MAFTNCLLYSIDDQFIAITAVVSAITDSSHTDD